MNDLNLPYPRYLRAEASGEAQVLEINKYFNFRRVLERWSRIDHPLLD